MQPLEFGFFPNPITMKSSLMLKRDRNSIIRFKPGKHFLLNIIKEDDMDVEVDNDFTKIQNNPHFIEDKYYIHKDTQKNSYENRRIPLNENDPNNNQSMIFTIFF